MAIKLQSTLVLALLVGLSLYLMDVASAAEILLGWGGLGVGNTPTKEKPDKYGLYEIGSRTYGKVVPRTGAVPTGMGVTTEFKDGTATHGQYRWVDEMYEEGGGGPAGSMKRKVSEAGYQVYSDRIGWMAYNPGGWEAEQRARDPGSFAPGGQYGPPKKVTKRGGTANEFLAGTSKVDWNPLAKRK